MVTKKNKKLTEDIMQIQIDQVDTMFLQEEFTQMQVALNNIIEQLSVNDLDETQINIIYQLNEICNAVIDQINVNVSAQII